MRQPRYAQRVCFAARALCLGRLVLAEERDGTLSVWWCDRSMGWRYVR